MAKEQNLEEQILQEAEKLFVEKGFSGTSTTDIARRVGCNQALVHYYFRTKENLFLQIFTQKIEMGCSILIKPLANIDTDFFEKLRYTIGVYFDFLAKNPCLAFFVLKEIIGNPNRLAFVYEFFMSNSVRANLYNTIDSIVQAEVGRGTIRNITTVNLVLDVISLTIFNFLALPIYDKLSESSEKERQQFVADRREEIITLIINGIKKN